MQSLSNLNKQILTQVHQSSTIDRKYSYGSHVPKMGITLGKKMSTPARHYNTINTISTPRMMLRNFNSNPVSSTLEPVRSSLQNRSVGNVNYISSRGRSMDRGIKKAKSACEIS